MSKRKEKTAAEQMTSAENSQDVCLDKFSNYCFSYQTTFKKTPLFDLAIIITNHLKSAYIKSFAESSKTQTVDQHKQIYHLTSVTVIHVILSVNSNMAMRNNINGLFTSNVRLSHDIQSPMNDLTDSIINEQYTNEILSNYVLSIPNHPITCLASYSETQKTS